MKTYYFVRHGASTADSGEMELNGVNAPATVEDIPLSDMGREEAERAADHFERLGNIDGVYSSPLSRTHDTAKIIAGRLGLEVKLLPEVKEVDLSGVLNFFKKGASNSPFKLGPKDMPLDVFRMVMRISSSFLFLTWRATDIPGNEPLSQARERLEEAFRVLNAAPEQRIVISSHGFFITYMASYFLQSDPTIFPRLRGRMWVPNCSVTKLTSTNGDVKLKYFARDDYENIR